MNNIKKAADSAKKFVVQHKTALSVSTAVAVTAVAVRKLDGTALAQHNEFLKEKGLFDEFYATPDEV